MCKRKYTTREVTLMNNIRKSNTRCYYCNEKVGINYRTVDHKIPVSRGGETIATNLVMSCERCNSEKGFLTEEEYREYREVADMLVSKNIKVTSLNSLLDSYKAERKSIISERKSLNKINKEIDKLILIIKDSKLSTSDCYNLCKMLQDNLKERDIANNKIIKLENNLRNFRKYKKVAKIMILLTESEIRSNYMDEYLSVKGLN